MPSRALTSARLRFGPFLLDPSSGQLRKGNILIKLPPQPFRLLELMVERAGTVLTREEIRNFLWPDSTFVDFEHGINFSINQIRAALSDNAEKPRYVETLPRRGYRFIGLLEPAETPKLENRSEAAPAVRELRVKTTDARHSWVTTGIVLNVLCLLAIGLSLRHREASPPEPEFQRLSFGRGMIRSARFAPDGQSVVYGAAWEGKPTQLFWTKAGSFESRPLGIEGEILAVSPSGQMAVLLNQRYGIVATQGTLALFSLTGSASHKVLDDVQEADWSPDGSKLAVIHYVAGVRCDLEYPVGKVLYETTGGAWLSDLRVSPRGDRIAFLEHPWAGDDNGFVEIVDLKGNKKILSQEFASTEGLAWGPSGGEIWFSGQELGRNGPRALYKVTTAGDRRLIRREAGNITVRDVSRSGFVAVTRDTLQSEIFSRIKGENQEREIGWLENSYASDLTPDGKLMLLSVQGEAAVGTGYSVYLRKTDGTPAVRLGDGLPMRFSPDGKWAVTTSPPFTPNPQVFLLPTGAGQPVTLTQDSLSHYCAALLPNGKTILFEGKEAGHARRSWTQSIEGGKAVPITPEGTVGKQVSADGKLLVAIDSEGRFWLYPIGGGRPRELLGIKPGEDIIRWSNNDKSLFVVSDGIPAKIYRVEVLDGRRQLVHTLAPSDAAGLWNIWPVLITPDGRSYVYSDYRVLSELYLVNGLR